MAKIEGNTIGGFRGKLGNLVGYSWKGVWCVRSRPARVHNPRTEAQQAHRTMFAEEVRLAGRMSWALNVGLATVADEMHMTPQNVFVKANQQAFSMIDRTMQVDWSLLVVSAGPVAPVLCDMPVVTADNVLTISFEKNPLHMRADAYDQVYAYAYSPELGRGFLAAPVYRRDCRIATVLPDDMADMELQVYCFVVDRQGRASDTCYSGSTADVAVPEADEAADGNDGQPIAAPSTDTSGAPQALLRTATAAPPGRHGGD